MKLTRLILSLFLLLLISGTVHAGVQEDYNRAVNAYKNKDYQHAFPMMRQLAERGVPDAQHAVGVMYSRGMGVPRDEKQAFHWFKKAATNGVTNSQIKVASYFWHGKGGAKKDPRKGQEWYQKAAESGNAAGQMMLGIFYFNGIAGETDHKKAGKWLLKSAMQNYESAYFPLGKLYFDQKKYNKAEKWLVKAAALNKKPAYGALGHVYEKQGKNKDALKWYEKGAEAGNADAQVKLGALYQDGGIGLPKDNAQARKWYELAAKQGHWFAKAALEGMDIADLGNKAIESRKALEKSLKFSGPGAKEFKEAESLVSQKQYLNAYRQFDAASKAGHRDAKKRMEEVKSQAMADLLNQKKAAANAGNARVQFELAGVYFRGDGVPKDINQGISWLEKAAIGGHPQAQLELGKFYFQKRDPGNATRWFTTFGESAARARNKQALNGAIQALQQIEQQLKYNGANKHIHELQQLSRRL